jgi:AraC-like DNA-binding protein
VIIEHRFAHIPQDARRGRAWISSLAPLFTASLAPDEAVPLDAFLRYQHLGSCVLAADKSPAQVLERTSEQARTQALDHLVLWTPLHGRARLVDRDQVGSVGPGEILVLDLSHPVRIEMEALAARALLVPHRLVDDGREPPDRYGRIVSRRDCHLDALVADHICRLGDCLPDLTATQVQSIASATLTLCRLLLQGQTSGSSSGLPERRYALGLAVRRYIESNLATVDAPTLMSRFGLSRTPLYHLFSECGGLYAYIRERRLAEAMRQLREVPAGGRPELARLAHACGFHNQTVFARAFRRRYGLNPSEVAIGELVPAGVNAADPTLLAWLREL